MAIDHFLMQGLKRGGWKGEARIYDWTEGDPGLDALINHKRNEVEAEKIAAMIVSELAGDPSLKITLISHSGGTGIAAWALERLPAGVQIQTWVMLASALSPNYDLTKALSHVRGRAYAYYSANDTLVLGAGTQMFGTIDGKKTMAAGLVGFKRPKGADAKEYDRLIQRPWVKGWMAYGNAGSHIGCLAEPFVKEVLTPVLIEALSDPPATQTATTQPQGAAHE